MAGRHCKGYKVVLPDEIKAYVYQNYHGVGPARMAKRIEDVFGLNVDANVMRAFYKNRRLDSGLRGYEKGNVPWNAGMKGYKPPGSEKTRFRKGHLPVQTVAVGTERISRDGYLEVKVAMPNLWKYKHRIVWEQTHGEIPKGYVVVFKDQNRRNFSPDNLMCVSRRQLSILNHQLKLGPFPEINQTKELISRMIIMRKGAKKDEQHL